MLYWDALPGLREAMVKPLSSNYVKFVCEDIKEYVVAHPVTAAYCSAYNTAFSGFREYLAGRLIKRYKEASPTKEEEIITDDIFSRLAVIKAIDKYEAYQVLDNSWKQIAVDLEMLQTEGDGALMSVDPNMVTKQKDGKDIEVQDGWAGHILPFELVQKLLLPEDLAAIKELERELASVASVYDDILDSLSEDEKDSNITDDINSSFVTKEVRAKVDEILEDIESEEISALKNYLALGKKPEKLAYSSDCKAVNWPDMKPGTNGLYSKAMINARITILKRQYNFPAGSFEAKIMRVADTMETEARLKKELRDARAALNEKTKTTIEQMNLETALMILEEKWVTPVCDGISALPHNLIAALVVALEHLAEKYNITFAEVGDEISKTEETISNYVNLLSGNHFDMEGLRELQKLIGGAEK
jgi:type I restriction enzyme M protein